MRTTDQGGRDMRNPLRSLDPITKALIACGVLLAALIILTVVTNGPRAAETPTITTTYYTEKSGRQCSQTVAHTAVDVSVSVSCSWPPAESRIADLLEGAGQ